MKTFLVRQYEVDIYEYAVKADTKAQAIARLLGDLGACEDGSSGVECNGLCNKAVIGCSFGLSLDDCDNELIGELHKLGVDMSDNCVQTIHSVEEAIVKKKTIALTDIVNGIADEIDKKDQS